MARQAPGNHSKNINVFAFDGRVIWIVGREVQRIIASLSEPLYDGLIVDVSDNNQPSTWSLGSIDDEFGARDNSCRGHAVPLCFSKKDMRRSQPNQLIQGDWRLVVVCSRARKATCNRSRQDKQKPGYL